VVAAYVGAAIEPLARSPIVTLVLAGLVGVAAVNVFLATSGPARKAGVPALGAALGFAGVLAAGSVLDVLGWQVDRTVLFAYDAVIVIVVVVLLLDLLAGRWTDATVSDLVVDLGGPSGTRTLQERLSRALGDPSLVLGYWIPERAGYVDDLGRPVGLPEPGGLRVVTEIYGDSERVAVLVHDSSVVDEDPRLVAGVTAAARMAVSNARLQAEVRARVGEIVASRRRLVEAADAQRRRIELDLREGTERTLERVAGLLGEASAAAVGVEVGALESLQDEATRARAELRDFAQGIRPSALEEGGLAHALADLARRSPIPVTIAIEVERLPPAIESALYFVCSESLANVAKHASATRGLVSVHVHDHWVVATVVDDGAGGADPTVGTGLLGLADRVEGLGGRFIVEDPPNGGTRVIAAVPLDLEHEHGPDQPTASA
jgi:signal transduction histidine kinase